MKTRILAILAAVLCLLLMGCKKETKPVASTPMPTLATGDDFSGNKAPGQTLGLQKVQKIALEHAGFTYDQVTHLHTNIDLDDGVYVYEVEFKQGGYNYEYTIHAESGEILDWDKDMD